MNGHDYEYLVAKYLRQHGYTGVKVTKGSGDFGVDVTAHKAGHKYAVQCKYYSSPVSLGAIQEAVAGKALYNCDRAMVVTNSTFTKAAQELAKANNVVLIDGIRSVGSFRFSQLPKAVRIALLGAYLFAASAAFVAMLNVNREQPFWTAVYNVVATMTFLLFPLWISPLIRGFKKLIQLIYMKSKIKKVESALEKMSVPAQPVQPKINAAALLPFLPIEVRDNRDAFAANLAELPQLTTSAIQRKCMCGYNCATSILRNLQAYGLVKETQQSTYEWTEKALLLGAEGRDG